jgi:hypothetical protein
MLPADLFLKVLYGSVAELNHLTTSETEKMIVVLMSQDMFIMTVSLPKDDLPEKTAFHHNPQGAVEGGPGNSFIPATYTDEKVIHLKMAVSRKNFPEDKLSLRGKLQTFRP